MLLKTKVLRWWSCAVITKGYCWNDQENHILGSQRGEKPSNWIISLYFEIAFKVKAYIWCKESGNKMYPVVYFYKGFGRWWGRDLCGSCNQKWKSYLLPSVLVSDRKKKRLEEEIKRRWGTRLFEHLSSKYIPRPGTGAVPGQEWSLLWYP